MTDNLRQTFSVANRLGKPIVHIKASHSPASKAPALKTVSGKEFGGMLTDIVAYEGMPMMLLTNWAPHFGLFNGAIGKFKGLLYLTEYIDVKLKPADKKFKFKDMVVTETFDLKMGHSSSHIHQLPKGSIIITVNQQKVTSDDDIKCALKSGEEKTFRVKLPASPPNIPDFVVVEFEGYKERGGTNILGYEGAENLVPIPIQKIKRETKCGSKKFGEYRIGFMLEAALSMTGFKGQGRNEKCAKISMKDFAHVAGLFFVCISRVRGPDDNHIPPGDWPTVLDINLQKLNSFVGEAELFERDIRIKSMKTIAKLCVEAG